MYKVGDIVVIRPELEAENDYGGVTFTWGMDEYTGDEAVIELVDDGGRFKIDLDDHEHWWSGSMFCGTKQEYESRNDWSKPFTLDMTSILQDDIEIAVAVRSEQDAIILIETLRSLGYKWLKSGCSVGDDTNYHRYGPNVAYWLSRTTVDASDLNAAKLESWDWVIKYTFQSVQLEDFDIPDTNLVLM